MLMISAALIVSMVIQTNHELSPFSSTRMADAYYKKAFLVEKCCISLFTDVLGQVQSESDTRYEHYSSSGFIVLSLHFVAHLTVQSDTLQ
jgi:hypothetical protein